MINICPNCLSQSSERKKRIVLGIIYLIMLVFLVVAVYAAITITLEKADIVPQNPSDLACPNICPIDYKFQVDSEKCCTSLDSISCKTKTECKNWILEHDRNYLIVAYAYITFFACFVTLHIFICLKRKCETAPGTVQKKKQKAPILRWKNKHGFQSDLSDSLFENQVKCEVCLKEIVVGKAINLSCCGGLAHPKCMKGWLQQIDNCPSCGKLLDSNSSK